MEKLRSLITRQEKIRIVLLFVAILVMAVLEVIGIASILPFMSLVADPSIIEKNEWLQWAYQKFEFADHRSMLVATGVMVLVLLTIANSFGAFITWLQHKFAWDMAHGVSTRLVRTYLAEPYTFFLTHNTANLLKKTLSEVNVLVNSVLITLTDLVARSLVSLVIFALLLLVDLKLALVVFGVLGGIYGLIYWGWRSYMTELGRERLDVNFERFKTLNELFTGIKAVQVEGAHTYFYHRFEDASRRLARIFPRFQLISQTPKYLIEVIAFGGILTITVYLLALNRPIESVIPLLSLYALAGYRLLPSLQLVFSVQSTG